MSAILKCTNLTKQYGKKAALADVNISLEKGKITGLLGPNGSGKTTFIKLLNGLLVPTSGEIRINGLTPCPKTKEAVSYLPDKTYLNDWMHVCDLFDYFEDFYSNFDRTKAAEMLSRLNINQNDRLKSMSKGTKEKVQLILVMSRNADLYVLDEPIGGVDPASRDYILNTIISNYNENAAVLISTHLISDIESILDDVIFLKDGQVSLSSSVDDIRMKQGQSIDSLFREVFKC